MKPYAKLIVAKGGKSKVPIVPRKRLTSRDHQLSQSAIHGKRSPRVQSQILNERGRSESGSSFTAASTPLFIGSKPQRSKF
jgi:hypothetical protein